MEEVASAAASLRPAPAAAGLLATAGTVRQRLYHAALGRRGIEVVAPDASGQRVVSEIIASVKAGDTGPAVRGRIRDAAEALVRAQEVSACAPRPRLGLRALSEDRP